MARYTTTVQSRLAPEEAFAYMAEFSNALDWDPSVGEARRAGDGPLRVGTAFDLTARFAGRDVQLHYEIVEFDPPTRVVLEARRAGFVSRDAITVTAAAHGSDVLYDARLDFGGVRRLLDPVMQRVFDRVGASAKAGMQEALNP